MKESGKRDGSLISDFRDFVQSLYIMKVPSYGNSFFYSLGFLLLTVFALLALTGIIMVFFGPFWWDMNPIGVFVRSIHFWAAEAFLLLLALHLFTVFSTSAFRTKKLIWIIGSAMLLLVMLQFAFGIGIRGDFVSQWNDLSAADLWNGAGLGYWVNPINFGALYGWHIAIVPITLLALMGTHYLMVKKKGISKPYRKDIPYKMVDADHKKMYLRGIFVILVILVFSFLFRASYVSPVTIASVAKSNYSVMAMTLLSEFNASSGTATYLDTIDPYAISTRQVFVSSPYAKYLKANPNAVNEEAIFNSEPNSTQKKNIKLAAEYFGSGGILNVSQSNANPLIPLISALVFMARSGLYDSALNGEAGSYLDTTYQLRFLSDTGVMDQYATQYGLQYSQWGVIKGTSGWWPPGLWLAAPYNYLEMTLINTDPNQDRDGFLISLSTFIVLILFPFIPFVNTLPDKLKLYKLFWNRFTIPEMKKKGKR